MKLYQDLLQINIGFIDRFDKDDLKINMHIMNLFDSSNSGYFHLVL
jgi:hypothetical protein